MLDMVRKIGMGCCHSATLEGEKDVFMCDWMDVLIVLGGMDATMGMVCFDSLERVNLSGCLIIITQNFLHDRTSSSYRSNEWLQ